MGSQTNCLSSLSRFKFNLTYIMEMVPREKHILTLKTVNKSLKLTGLTHYNILLNKMLVQLKEYFVEP